MSTGLEARTERLDAEVDLVALAGEDGVLFERGGRRRGFAGRGGALRIDVPRDPPAAAAKAVHAALDAIGGPGRAVALGALPFAPDRPGELVVPEVLVGRDDDGTRWVTTVLPTGAGPADHDALVESVVALRDRSDPPAPAG
jgi:menaquinone-specific isochorismate synthase